MLPPMTIIRSQTQGIVDSMNACNMLPTFPAQTIRTLLTIVGTLFLALPPLIAADGKDFEENIQRVFADDQMADFRVIFGYDNNKDFMDPCDPVRARNLMTYLVSHSFTPVAITENQAEELGVPLTAQNLRVFAGPGSQGQSLRVSMIWSSATSSTAKNIGVGRNLQLRCSHEALKFMQKAATDAEVQVYVGHSREGGGPDTFPPVTLTNIGGDRQQVDYSYYGNSQPGLESLGSYFLKARKTPHLIAWTSCATDRHFRGWLSRVLSRKNSATSLVLSTRLTDHIPEQAQIEGRDEGLMVVTRLIEALQKHQSKVEFMQSLLSCEIDSLRVPLKPAWKLSALP
jgi:hypothetical protein